MSSEAKTRSSLRDTKPAIPGSTITMKNSPTKGNASTQTLAQGESSTPTPNETSQDQQSQSQKLRIKRLGLDPTLIISGNERSKRKRTQSEEPEHNQQHSHHHAGEERDPKDPIKAKELGNVIYRKIMDARSSDGEEMAQPFIRLPNRRSFPDYYETIKHPMSLEMVHGKLEASEYQTLKDVCADLGQIFNNAKRYNVKESLIFQYAKKLHKMTRVYYTNITSPNQLKEESDSEGEHDVGFPPQPQTSGAALQPVGAAEDCDDDEDAEGEVDAEGELDAEGDVQMGETSNIDADGNESSSTAAPATAGSGQKRTRRRGAYMKDGPSVYKLIKPVLKAIKEAKAKDGSGREIAGIFLRLPSRRDFPDYYTTIRNPISLEEIESKQVGRRYEAFQEFVDDVDLMCKNGMTYNEDGSEVYRDAQQIRDILSWHQNVSRPSYTPRPSSVTPIPARMTYLPGPSYSPSPATYSRSPAGAPNPPPIPMPAPGFGLGPIPSPSAYATGPPRQSMPGMQGPRAYLPALPPGVVTEEIVASLERYPLYERQAWAQSLPPLAMNMYRSMVATNEARKRGIPPTPQYPPNIQQPQPQPQQQQQQVQQQLQQAQQVMQQQQRLQQQLNQPSPQHQQQQQPHRQTQMPQQTFGQPNSSSISSRPLTQSTSNHGQSSITTPAPAQKVEKPKPPIPTIKYIDFAFHSPGEREKQDPNLRQTIRIKNLRGVITHSILLNSTTSEIELTAYIDDATPPSSQVNGGSSDTVSSIVPVTTTTPELSLRINGNQGSLPRFIFENPQNTNQISNPDISGGSGDNSTINGIGKQGERPKAMKWIIHVSTSRIESKIEIIATKPGALAETTTIFVSRQF